MSTRIRLMAPDARPYHHGHLRPALLAAAVEIIGEVRPAALSLREVARRARVTHAAAAYHFGDKAGLLTAVAAEATGCSARPLRRRGPRAASSTWASPTSA